MNKLKCSVFDSEKWKNIKRNGHFGKKRRLIIKVIGNNQSFPQHVRIDPIEKINNNKSQQDIWIEENNPTSDKNYQLNDNNLRDNNWNDEPIDHQNNFRDNEISEKKISFCGEITAWALNHQITQSALKSLLLILRSKLPNEDLPSDARTLLKTPREKICESIPNENGKYWHYGLQKVLLEALIARNILLRKQYTLNINIDGLPMFRSSTESFWPILVEIHEFRSQVPPLVVGIFCGKSKNKNK